MKMLKKAGALAIAGAMAMSLGTISAFADSAITLGTIEYTPATEESSIATFKVPYTAAAGVSQVTLLAELGAAEGVFANAIAYSTTAYIDQEAADTYFEFKIDDSRLQLAEDQEKLFLNVKVGGTGVSTPATAALDITPKSDEPTVEEQVAEQVAGALIKKDDAVVTGVYGLANVGLMSLDVTSLVSAGDIDVATQGLTINGAPAVFVQYVANDATVTKAIAMVDTTVANTVVALTDVPALVTFGNLDKDTANAVDIFDANEIVKLILADDTNATGANDTDVIIADVNADNAVDIFDANEIVKYILSNNTYAFPVYAR